MYIYQKHFYEAEPEISPGKERKSRKKRRKKKTASSKPERASVSARCSAEHAPLLRYGRDGQKQHRQFWSNQKQLERAKSQPIPSQQHPVQLAVTSRQHLANKPKKKKKTIKKKRSEGKKSENFLCHVQHFRRGEEIWEPGEL